jgi:purine-binding chemotaxis protein CheW
MKKKIRDGDPTAPQPSTTRRKRKAPPAVASDAAESPAAPTPKPRRNSAPVEIARALSHARSSGEIDVAETLAQIEARAAAAYARELAESEAAAESSSVAEVAPEAARSGPPGIRRAVSLHDDDEDDEDDAYDDRWDDDAYAQHRGPRRSLRERARSRTGIVELLMFRVGAERFAVELLCVEEAIDLPEPHHVPEMPPAMLGVITVRETLTPVFTPDHALGVPAESKVAALIFRSARGRFALAIDDVDDVLTLDLAQLRDAPGIDGGDALILGVARSGSGIVALVDAEALIAACQATPIPELA